MCLTLPSLFFSILLSVLSPDPPGTDHHDVGSDKALKIRVALYYYTLKKEKHTHTHTHGHITDSLDNIGVAQWRRC